MFTRSPSAWIPRGAASRTHSADPRALISSPRSSRRPPSRPTRTRWSDSRRGSTLCCGGLPHLLTPWKNRPRRPSVWDGHLDEREGELPRLDPALAVREEADPAGAVAVQRRTIAVPDRLSLHE